MKSTNSRRSTAIVLALALSLPGCMPQAESPATPDALLPLESAPQTELSANFLEQMKRKPERAKRAAETAFDRHAVDGVVTREAVQKLTAFSQARARGQFIGKMLSLDLDGDMEISQAELLNLTETEIRKHASHADRSRNIPYASADLDKNGVITSMELQTFARIFASPVQTRGSNDPALELMAFDDDGDGRLTRAEFEASLARLAVTPPETKPKTVSDREKAKSKLANGMRDGVCKPDVQLDTSAKAVLVSGYSSDHISSIAVTGQDRNTTVTTLFIEPGESPLNIVASAYRATIWKLEGQVDRVASFSAVRSRTEGFAGAGVVGLPKAKVSFLPSTCMPYFKSGNSKPGLVARAKFARILGDEAPTIVSSYTISDFALPSGTARTAAQKKSASGPGLTIIKGDRSVVIKGDEVRVVKTGSRQISKDPVVTLSADSVIAPGPVEPYRVLPEAAGLRQLIEEGKLERLEDSSYLIKADLTDFPAGLAGGNSVKFLLGKGVKIPSDRPGHSSILDLETGLCLTKRC